MQTPVAHDASLALLELLHAWSASFSHEELEALAHDGLDALAHEEFEVLALLELAQQWSCMSCSGDFMVMELWSLESIAKRTALSEVVS